MVSRFAIPGPGNSPSLKIRIEKHILGLNLKNNTHVSEYLFYHLLVIDKLL